MELGQYSVLSACRFCDNNQLIDIIHMGNKFPLAGGFLHSLEEVPEEKVYPLSLVYCEKCCLLQCKEIINPDILFRNKKGYFYHSSEISTLVSHFSNYAKQLASMYTDEERKNILCVEIGCNDGVFLRPLQREGFKVIGIDPSSTTKKLIEDGFEIYNDYFNDATTDTIVQKHGQCDIFLSSNSFAHINDMKCVMRCLKKILKSNGTAIIEVHDTKSVIDELNFDFIYHEHMSYYTLTSFYRISRLFDFTIEKVEFTKVHGQSIRVFLKNGIYPLNDNIKTLLAKEIEYTDIKTYLTFSQTVEKWREEFNKFFTALRVENKIVYGYGSSGRANIICTYANIHLDVMIDDAKNKIGSFTPISHLQIQSSDIISTTPPDYILVLAWPYASDIINNIKKIYPEYKGRFIIPLPRIQVQIQIQIETPIENKITYVKTEIIEGHIPTQHVDIETGQHNPWCCKLPPYSITIYENSSIIGLSRIYSAGAVHNTIDAPFHFHNAKDGRGKNGTRQCFSIDNQELILKYLTNKIREKDKINIVEIGVNSINSKINDDDFNTTSTSIFLTNKRNTDMYLGIDINDKSALNNSEKNIYTIATPSEDCEKVFKYMNDIKMENIDILFIDGLHSINQVYKEWRYTQKLADKGVVIFHDTNSHPGPYFILKSIDTNMYSVYKYFNDIVDFGIGVAVKK